MTDLQPSDWNGYLLLLTSFSEKNPNVSNLHSHRSWGIIKRDSSTGHPELVSESTDGTILSASEMLK